jgi:hypothetical protein
VICVCEPDSRNRLGLGSIATPSMSQTHLA